MAVYGEAARCEAFLGSDVILAQQGVSVSFQSRYGAIIIILSKEQEEGHPAQA